MPNKGKVQDTFTISFPLDPYDRHSVEEFLHQDNYVTLTCLCGKQFGGPTVVTALDRHAVHARQANFLEKHNLGQLYERIDHKWWAKCYCGQNFIGNSQIGVMYLWDVHRKKVLQEHGLL